VNRSVEYLVCGAVGAGLGYLFTRRHLEDEFQKRLDGQIQNADEFYRLKYEKQLKAMREKDIAESKDILGALRAGVESVEEIHKEQAEALVQGVTVGALAEEIAAKKPSVLVSDEDLTNTLRNYQGMFKGSAPSEFTEVTRELDEDLDRSTDSPAEVSHPEMPKPNHPVIISTEAFMENGSGFKQVSLIYYAGDDILATASNAIVSEGVRLSNLGEEVVEKLKMGLDGNGEVIYVRNKSLAVEYEIFRDHNMYTEAVGPIGSVT
jgi:hypothetical protein